MPEDINCKFCFSLELCTNYSKLSFTLKTLFNDSLLDPTICETNTTNGFIELNTPVEVQPDERGYYFRCTLCENLETIYYLVEGSAFTNVSDCPTNTNGMYIYIQVVRL